MFKRKNILNMMIGVALFSLAVCMCVANVYAEGEAASPSKTTLDNLMYAYNGEFNANARYLAFAVKANEEGYDIAASLFRAAAMAEQVHYERHAEVIKSLGGTPIATPETPVVNSTKENLESAFNGETYEKNVMYPAFLEQAKKENIAGAIEAFENAEAAEGVHAKLYAKMLVTLESSKGLVKVFYVCPVCGNVVDAITSAMCPICSTDTRKFKMVK